MRHGGRVDEVISFQLRTRSFEGLGRKPGHRKTRDTWDTLDTNTHGYRPRAFLLVSANALSNLRRERLDALAKDPS